MENLLLKITEWLKPGNIEIDRLCDGGQGRAACGTNPRRYQGTDGGPEDLDSKKTGGRAWPLIAKTGSTQQHMPLG